MGIFSRLFGKDQQNTDGRSSARATHGFQAELQYCPQCGDEYQAGWERCASCQVRLVSGQERIASWYQEQRAQTARSRPISENEAIEVILQGKLRDLKMQQLALRQQEIASRTVAVAAGCSSG